jgi:ADP-heptose:LPS heptosyltransferase
MFLVVFIERPPCSNCYIIFSYIKGEPSLNIGKDDIAIRAWWSFYEHHQKHISKSSVEYICNTDYTDDIPLEYELDIFDYDVPKIVKAKEELIELSNGKPIVGIAPAYTMFSRMWSVEQWEKLTDLLHDEGYFVVALGGNNDLKPKNVDLYKCGKYPIRQIPHILGIFESLFTLNSGMLHLASVNQDLPIVYISVGQFPPELIAPYRHGRVGGGKERMLFIRHNCPAYKECFQEHIEEIGINRQANVFIDKWKRETGEDFKDEGLLQKYICWHYCKLVMNKYKCSKIITPQRVMERYKEWR